MKIKKLEQALTVCKVRSIDLIDLSDDIFFIGKTDDELSLVCRTESTPDDTVSCEDGWRGFRIDGTLDLSLTGVLSKITAILADAGIAIFAVSTFNTDYILVKEENFEKALDALGGKGYEICG
jgi:hypothetical protein